MSVLSRELACGRVLRRQGRPFLWGEGDRPIRQQNQRENASMYVLEIALACGALALVYGIWASRSVLAADAGSERMREIAGAIQEGGSGLTSTANTSTIGIVGAVVAIVLAVTLGLWVAGGFIIGAILSGAAGYIGMHVSVRANVRTTQAGQNWLEARFGHRLSLWRGQPACWWSASASWVWPAITRCWARRGAEQRTLIEALVALSFGGSLISIFARLGGGHLYQGRRRRCGFGGQDRGGHSRRRPPATRQ